MKHGSVFFICRIINHRSHFLQFSLSIILFDFTTFEVFRLFKSFACCQNPSADVAGDAFDKTCRFFGPLSILHKHKSVQRRGLPGFGLLQ